MIVMTLALVTGALHLDGLADTSAMRSAPAPVVSMHSPSCATARIGTFGTLALIFVIGSENHRPAGVHGAHRYAPQFMFSGLARWAMTGIGYGLEYLREQGAGTPAAPTPRAAPPRNLRRRRRLSQSLRWLHCSDAALCARR